MMKFKIYDHANGIMYMNAENIDDPKWNFARLHHNIHCTTCVSVGKSDKNNIDIYTYDILQISDLLFVVGELENGETKLNGINSNIEERLENFDTKDISVLGTSLEMR